MEILYCGKGRRPLTSTSSCGHSRQNPKFAAGFAVKVNHEMRLIPWLVKHIF
jgi:hypothetical protein